MPRPFRPLSIAEAENQIATFRFMREIRFVDTHHTWRPNKAQYKGLATIEAINRFHTMPKEDGGNGWSDIGEHWTIGPEGAIWTGRDLNVQPCSATGFNAGALMYEMIGDFDGPEVPGRHDTLGGAQLDAAVAISAAVLARFKLPLAHVRFHRHLHAPGAPEPKTCPGTSVDYEAFKDLVAHTCQARWNYTPNGADLNVAAAFEAGDASASHGGAGFA